MNYPVSIADYVVRDARPDDCAQILQFVRELAVYEKLADQVVATEHELNRHLFGDVPRAEVLMGEYRTQPVGFALYFHNFSTFLGRPGIYLEDLFVRPAFRGRGFGKALLQTLARIAITRDCGRLEWSVLDWNTPAIEFYQSLGAEQLNEWIGNRLTGQALRQVADPAGHTASTGSRPGQTDSGGLNRQPD